MNTKYELTTDTVTIDNVALYRVKAIKSPATGRVSLASSVATTSADRLSCGHYLTHKELGWLKDLDCLLRKNLELKS